MEKRFSVEELVLNIILTYKDPLNPPIKKNRKTEE